ncbi:transposase [bacterium]|nr:transposase [bacterium]
MNESMMKTDQRGRLRYTPEQKQTMVDAYRASGLTAPRFAAHHGVNYQTLVSWIKKDKQLSSATTPGGPPSGFFSLIPAVIEGCGNPPLDGAIEVFIPGGARLSITSASQVALAVALIRQLEQARPC